jgi:hypothetical protein
MLGVRKPRDTTAHPARAPTHTTRSTNSNARRDAKHAPGIDRSRVEEMEVRLKADVLREAARYDSHILVTEEDDDMNVRCVWRCCGCCGCCRAALLCCAAGAVVRTQAQVGARAAAWRTAAPACLLQHARVRACVHACMRLGCATAAARRCAAAATRHTGHGCVGARDRG